MRRTITGSSSAGTMTLGDLRKFVASLDGFPDEAVVKAQTSLRRRLRAVTVEEDDSGFRDFVQSVKSDEDKAANKSRTVRKEHPKESTSA